MKNKNLLLYNGKFITLDDKEMFIDWIYIKDGYIEELGIGEGYKKYKTQVTSLDLKGNCVIPGFIDSHVHLVQTGLNMLGNDASKCRAIKDLLEIIKNAKVEESDFGPVIRCVRFEEIKFKEGRMPTRWELDSVQSEKIVWVSSVEYQITIVNTHTYKFLELPFNIGGIQRDDRGIPTGILTGRANFIARRKLLSIINDKTRAKGVKVALDNAIKQGVTTINAMEGGFLFHEKDAFYVYNNLKDFPIDVELFFQTTDISKIEAMGLKRIGGSILLDGSFQARNAALEYHYEDMEDTNGELYFTDEELEKFIFEGFKKEMDMTVHAVGSRAIGQILNVYDKANKKFPFSKSMMRIEYFEIPSQSQIKLAAELGVILSMKPAIEYFWGDEGRTYERRLGKMRKKRTNPHATLIANGCIIAGGSESDLTPINPLLGMHAAVNHPNIDERVSPLEALKMFTINGAIAIGQENIKGKLGLNYMGDLCILDKNPLECDAKKIKDIVVLGMIKSGEIMFLSEDTIDWRDRIVENEISRRTED